MSIKSALQDYPFRQDYNCPAFVEKAGAGILAAALAMGIALRLYMFLLDRSLWFDPALLALNVVEKNYLALFGPLENIQMAPAGFLIASKFIGSAFSYSEFALTLLPLLFGLGALILFLCLCIELFGRSVAPLAFIPFASCSTAVFYSSEFKPYSSDLFFSVCILFVAHRVMKERFSGPWIAAFGMVGLISVWFSNTAIILLAGTGIALVLNIPKQRNPKSLGSLIIAETVIFTHYIALYFLQIRPATPEAQFRNFADYFAPIFPLSIKTWSWWYHALVGYAEYPLNFHGYGIWLSLAALAIGLAAAYGAKFRRAAMHLFLFPAAVLLVLSILHLYPIPTGQDDIHSRLVLFTIPIAFILIASGINAFAKLFPKSILITAILGALLIYPSIKHLAFSAGFIRQEMRPLVAYFNRHYSPEDTVYVYEGAVPAFRFYTRNKSIRYDQGTTMAAGDLPKDLSRVMSGKRIWAIISHDYSNNHDVIKGELETRHGPVFCKEFPGAWLLLSTPEKKPN